MHIFYTILANTLASTIANMSVWFGLTFYAYLETQSVFVTGMIGGIYLLLVFFSGFWFGSIVDHHHKRSAMLYSSCASLICYGVSYLLLITYSGETFARADNAWFWIFAILTLGGTIWGNIRTIALPTLVTLLITEDRRDKANGLVGMTTGISFGIVSVISGLLIGYYGMETLLGVAICITVLTILHILFISIPEKEIVHVEGQTKTIDIKGTYVLVRTIPGLITLILFTTFNNFLGGAFMALMDAYGLSLVDVQIWGVILGILSFSFMLGGIVIARYGLGSNPLRSMLRANLVIWTTCIFFTIQPSLILLIIGMFVYMSTFPFIEASEHTVIQKVVPYERQGRVIGFAQSIEQMASPITAFVVGPLTQFIFIPLMTDGYGARLIGNWFGVGPNRGIALVFMLAGALGVSVTAYAFRTQSYRLLSKAIQT